jgi:hypothetical protein
MNAQIIKGTIWEILEVLRDLYDADVAAMFLVNEDMDNEEKLDILEDRLSRIKTIYHERATPLPEPVSTYVGLDRSDLQKCLSEIRILKFCFEEVQHPLISEGRLYPERNGKIWNYNYKSRPAKWVVFPNDDKNSPILFEGLTAYSIKTTKEIFADSSTALSRYPSISHLNAIEMGVTAQCKMVCFLHLKDPDDKKKIIGLVKIENYQDRPAERIKFSKDSTQTKEAKQYLPLLARLVKKSKERYKERAYEKLYGGLEFLEVLKTLDLTKARDLNREIYRQTRHLLFVLKRNEYVGHDDIFERVTNYVDDIASILKIAGKKSFKEILEEYKKHEDLILYGIKGYRDHFIHQFHVFVLGYIILNKIGLKIVAESTDQSLRTIQDRPDHKIHIREDNVLRAWFLTAFYHDAAPTPSSHHF